MNFLQSCLLLRESLKLHLHVILQPTAQADELKRLPLVAESLDSRGLYIYDDGFRFVIWFGRMLSPEIAMNLLGQDFAADLSKVCSFISNGFN